LRFTDDALQHAAEIFKNDDGGGAGIDELMAQNDIDGVLVGGASLDPISFARIANYQVPVAV
jgi:hypothetical protein